MTSVGVRPVGHGPAQHVEPRAPKNSADNKVERVWGSQAISKLSFGGRSFRPQDDDFKKLPDNLQNDIFKYLKKLFEQESVKTELQTLLPNGGNVDFKLTEEEGFILIVGDNKVKVADYSEFIKESWYKTNTFQREFFKKIKEAQKFVEKTDIGQREIVYVTKPGHVDERIQDVFVKTLKELEEHFKEMKSSFFGRYRLKFLNTCNFFSITSNLCSVGTSNGFILTGALLNIIKGLALAMYAARGFYEDCYFIKKSEENTGWMKSFFTALGSLESAFKMIVVLVGGSLVAASIFVVVSFIVSSEFIRKIGFALKAYLFGYILCNLFGTIGAILMSIHLINTIRLRSKLNSFLENEKLSEKERLRGYLQLVKEQMVIDVRKKNKIIDKVTKKEREKIKKENEGISEDEIRAKLAEKQAEIDRKIDSEISKAIKSKIQSLVGKTSKATVKLVLGNLERILIGLDIDNQEVLSDARKLIKAIDKATYQKIFEDIGYIVICVLCVSVGMVINLFGGPIGNAIFWMTIALMFLVWDLNIKAKNVERKENEGNTKYRLRTFYNGFKKYFPSRNVITNKLYQWFRKDKVKGFLGEVQERIDRVDQVAQQNMQQDIAV